MIDRVLAKKRDEVKVCTWMKDPRCRWKLKYQCGFCCRGICYVWLGENGLGTCQDRKECSVCKAKFTVTEVSR